MRNIITISLSDKMLKKLIQECKEKNTSRSEIVRESLERYFFVRELTKIRNKAISELTRKGIVITEEQIFKNIS